MARNWYSKLGLASLVKHYCAPNNFSHLGNAFVNVHFLPQYPEPIKYFRHSLNNWNHRLNLSPTSREPVLISILRSGASCCPTIESERVNALWLASNQMIGYINLLFTLCLYYLKWVLLFSNSMNYVLSALSIAALALSFQ